MSLAPKAASASDDAASIATKSGTALKAALLPALSSPVDQSEQASSASSSGDIRQSTEAPRRTRPKLIDGSPMSSTIQWYPPPRRAFSRLELLADRSINFLGAWSAWFAALWLAYASSSANDPLMKQVSFWVHGAGLVIMLNLSALYHYLAWDWRYASELLTLDHIGISAMIVGGYAPVMMQCSCYHVFIFVCCLGLAVVPMEAVRLWQLRRPRDTASVTNWSCIDILHIIRYLVMGWACIIVAPTLRKDLPTEVLRLMVAGGLLYSGGVLIFIRDKLQFNLAIWHFTVLLASSCFYVANLWMLVGRPLPVSH